MITDPTIFNDIADALNIKEPSFVEKDYYAIQLLKVLNELEISEYKIIFSGGTCLSKAYQNTYRMSEDIDMKFIERPMYQANRTKSHRKKFSKLITDAIEKSKIFKLNGAPKFRDVYRAQNFEIQYPKNFNHPALKSILKLELVETVIYEPTCNLPVCSMYAELMKKSMEISSIECVNMESIAVEKLIALLWRTSACALDESMDDDPALVRHLYDIHLLLSAKRATMNPVLLKKISIQSLEVHAIRYKNKHPEFAGDPKKVLSHGLQEIQTKPLHQERYEQFLSPLVYAQNPPSWNEVLGSLEKLYQELYLA